MMTITTLIGLYTSRVVLRQLGFTDSGIYNVVGGMVLFVSFVQIAMANATNRYLNVAIGAGDKENMQRTFNTSYFLCVLCSLLLVVICEAGGVWYMGHAMKIPAERFEAAKWVFHISVATMVAVMMSSPYNSLIYAHERMHVFAYITVVESIARLFIALSIPLFYTDHLVIYAILIFAVQVLVRLAYAIYSRRNFEECRISFSLDKSIFHSMLKFSSYNIFTGLGMMATGHGLNVLLSAFYPPVINAARSISIQVQNLMTKFMQSFMQATNPQITKLYVENALEDMHRMVSSTARYSFYLVLLISLPLLLETESLLTLWLIKYPDYTISFCRYIILITMLDGLVYPFLVGAAANGRVNVYYTVMGLLLFSVIPLAWLGLKLGYGPTTVYVVHLFVAIVVCVWRIVYGARMFKYKMSRFPREVLWPIVKVTFFAVVPSLAVHAILPGGNMGISIVNCILSVLFTMISVWYVGMSNAEHDYIIKNIKSRL